MKVAHGEGSVSMPWTTKRVVWTMETIVVGSFTGLGTGFFVKMVYGTRGIQGVLAVVKKGASVLGHRWGAGWSMHGVRMV